MSNLFVDIETIPAPEEFHAVIANKVRAPKTLKKPESIAEWERNERPALVQKAIRDSGLNPNYGRIFCIGWAVDNEWAKCLKIGDGGNELTILKDFFNRLENVSVERVIGHCVATFDLPFIWKRSVINRVPNLKEDINWHPSIHHADVWDTCYKWTNDKNDHISLDEMAKILGLQSHKDEIDGSMVWDLYAAGEYGKIAAYCMADVELTRKIYNLQRMKNNGPIVDY